MADIDFDTVANDTTYPAADAFDPAEFLVTPREEKAATSKLEAGQAVLAADAAYKLALKSMPPPPKKFLASFAKNSGQPVTSPYVKKAHDAYVADYPRQMEEWRAAEPKAAERFDIEAKAKEEEEKKKALAAKNRKKKVDGPTTPLGELVKQMMLALDDARYKAREIEKAIAAGALEQNGGENAKPEENGHAEEAPKPKKRKAPEPKKATADDGLFDLEPLPAKRAKQEEDSEEEES